FYLGLPWRFPRYARAADRPRDTELGAVVSVMRKLSHSRERPMLSWAATFLIIAIIAAVFGFGGIAAASANIAQILFVVFLVLFAVSLIVHLMRRATA